MRCSSPKDPIGWPPIDKTRSPGRKPAASAALPSWTEATRAAIDSLAVNREDPRKDRNCQDEICNRPGGDNGRPRCNRLMKEADLADPPQLICAIADGSRYTGGVLIAEELDVTAQRDCRNLPAGAVAIVAADQFGAEANGKHQDPDSARARR